MNLTDELKQRSEEMGAALDEDVLGKLTGYIQLLDKWNRVYNLTAVREPEKMLYQHLLDSLAVLPWITGGRLLDVGSGGGLPGIPLAIARPEVRVTLLDASSKKTTFLRQAAVELGLDNVSVICDRVEAYQSERFDLLISRAFSELGEFAALARHHLAEGGRMLAMKGVYPYDEIQSLPDSVAVSEVVPLTVPGLNAQRHLVVMTAVE